MKVDTIKMMEILVNLFRWRQIAIILRALYVELVQAFDGISDG